MKNNYKKDDLIAITGDIGLAALGFRPWNNCCIEPSGAIAKGTIR